MADRITLLDATDAHNFTIGTPIAVTFGRDGRLVPLSRWQRARARVSRLWARITWWRQSRIEVVGVDRERGEITVATMRWSWRRWKWVRCGG